MTSVLDTSVFNKVVEGVFSRDELPHDAEFVICHIQVEELSHTSDKERRAQLFLALANLRPTLVPTECMVWDTSRWDHAKWGDGVIFTAVRDALNALNKGKRNNTQDALIAEVGIMNGHTLITSDKHLADVVQQQGGEVKFIPPKEKTPEGA